MTAGEFWSFSTALYARPGVEPALLALQDGHGLEVNGVLFCIFAGRRGQDLGAAEAAAVCRIGRDWGRGVVGHLREARRSLKPLLSDSGTGADAAVLREEVKRLELAAEKAMQGELEKLAAVGGPGSRAVAEANLAVWLGVQGLAPTAERRRLFGAVLDAAFG